MRVWHACAALAWSLSAWAEPPDLHDFQIENPAPGVYVHYGAQAEMSVSNAGDVANLGFVVGATCVAVIDTGGTYSVGRALRLAIRRVTTLPVCYVINTHVHPDHVFGNQAFVEDRPEFVGHARLAEGMRRRGAQLSARAAEGSRHCGAGQYGRLADAGGGKRRNAWNWAVEA